MPVVSYWAESYVQLPPPSPSYLCVQMGSATCDHLPAGNSLFHNSPKCHRVILNISDALFPPPTFCMHGPVLHAVLMVQWQLKLLPLSWAWGAEVAFKSSSPLPAKPQHSLTSTISEISFISGFVAYHASQGNIILVQKAAQPRLLITQPMAEVRIAWECALGILWDIAGYSWAASGREHHPQEALLCYSFHPSAATIQRGCLQRIQETGS